MVKTYDFHEFHAGIKRRQKELGHTAYQPRARSKRYYRHNGRMNLALSHGCSFTFSPRMITGLEDATDEQIAAVKLYADGFGLHWPDPDISVTVPDLVAGLVLKSTPRP